MKYDFKKEQKQFYSKKLKPEIIQLPELKYIAIEGKGDPNEDNGSYQEALKQLYGLVFTIKMSKMGDFQPEGYFDFVTPPLEGLWWNEELNFFESDVDKSQFNWISMIQVPSYVTPEVLEWAKENLKKKKMIEADKAQLITIEEGLVVQGLHKGAYDNEKTSIEKIEQFAKDNGYEIDLNEKRRHHEIYYSDPRRCNPDNLKTLIRIPIK